jgi:hypothetical protein
MRNKRVIAIKRAKVLPPPNSTVSIFDAVLGDFPTFGAITTI